MPLPLPGFVDTGNNVGVGYSLTLAIVVYDGRAYGYPTLGGWQISIGEWQLYHHNINTTDPACVTLDNPAGYKTVVRIVATHPDDATEYVLYSQDVCNGWGQGPTLATISITLNQTVSLFRLGVAYGSNNPAHPLFVERDYRLTYRWFSDDGTVLTSTLTGPSGTASYTRFYNARYGDPAPGTLLGPYQLVGAMHVAAGMPEYFDSPNPIPDPQPVVLTISGIPFDTTGLTPGVTVDDTSATGSGGTITVRANGGFTAGWSLPYQVGVNIHVFDNAGNDLAAQVLDPFLASVQLRADGVTHRSPETPFVTCPYSGGYTLPNVDWDTAVKQSADGVFGFFTILASWFAAQDPPLDNGHYWGIGVDGSGFAVAQEYPDTSLPVLDSHYDTYLGIIQPAIVPPGPGLTGYIAGTIEIPPLEVNRPDGNTPSNWVTSDAAKLAVTEHAGAAPTGYTEIVVTSTGAHVTRTLVSNRANYLDLTHALGGPLTNPDAEAAFASGTDAYSITRHNRNHDYPSTFGRGGPLSQTIYPEDVWWWETFSFLDLVIVSPAAQTLTLTVTYTTLAVTDPHWEGSIRLDEMVYSTGGPFTQDYTFDTRFDGAHPTAPQTITVDLRFQSGGLIKLGQIVSLKLSGFAVGTTLLESATLNAKTHPYLKLGFGTPRHADYGLGSPDRDDLYGLGDHPGKSNAEMNYDAPVIAVDGQQVFGDIPDQANKTEPGQYGGGIRYCDPVTVPPENAFGDPLMNSPEHQDSQVTIGTFLQRLNDVEGIVAVWNGNVANTDAYAVQLGPELAQWLEELLPAARLIGETNLVGNPRCTSVDICNGHSFSLGVKKYLGGGVEVLSASSAGVRQAGITVGAARDDTDTVVATAMTDAQGYTILTPIGANGDRLYEINLEEAGPTVALRPRDLARFFHVSESGAVQMITPDCCHDTWGGFHRVAVFGGIIYYWRANHATPPPWAVMLNPVATGTQPRVDWDHEGRVHILYMDGGGNTQEVVSDDDGLTWEAPALSGTGWTHPRTAVRQSDGTILRAGYHTGNLQGTRQDAGSHTQSAPFTFLDAAGSPLAVADDTFGLSPGIDVNDPWEISVIISGETAVSDWWSEDEGQTWTRAT